MFHYLKFLNDSYLIVIKSKVYLYIFTSPPSAWFTLGFKFSVQTPLLNSISHSPFRCKAEF
jgi:hypothetical protein